MSTTSGTAAGPVDRVLAELEASVDALAVLADPTGVGRIEGADAVAVLRRAMVLSGRLSAIAARTVPVVEADGWWTLDGGALSITAWVAGNGRISHGQARQVVTLGRAMRADLPETAEAAVSGSISIEAAYAIASVATTPLRKAALAAPTQDCGEGFLVEQARQLPLGQLRVLARRWAAAADPAADERGFREASEREFLGLSDTTDGCHLRGFLTTEHGHALRTALDAMTNRSAEGAGEPAGRKRAGALTNLVRTVLDRDLTGATGTHRPHITCVVDLETLSRALGNGPGVTPGGVVPAGDVDRFAVGELIGTGPIPDSVLARLACDSQLTREVFGPQSQVLNVGRTERTYTGHKRRAIIARDRHCQFPGCDAPPAMSEIHHTDHWLRDGGKTDVATGCLLCWAHHEQVHSAGIEIRRDGSGRWRFTDRHGQPLRDP